jgi:hypothetical protein
MTRPGRLRDIANGVGRPLPESIGDRIRNDLTGSAVTPGHPQPCDGETLSWRSRMTGSAEPLWKPAALV